MVVLPTACPVCDADGELAWLDGELVCEACGRSVSDLIQRRPSMNGHGAAEAPQALGTRGLDLSRLRPVEWCWQGYLVRGVLNLLTGEEGVGKGTLLAWLIAQLTTGKLPGAFHGQPQRVLWVGDEDSWEQAVGPRLYAADADLGLVRELTLDSESALLDVARDADALRALLQRESYALVAFEALVDNLPRLRNPNDMHEIRAALRPLRRVLTATQTTGLGTLHTTKVETGEFRRKQGGSHQFNALSRSSLFLGLHPDGSERRGLARGKGNYGAPPTPLSFQIVGWAFQLNDHQFLEPRAQDFQEEPELALDDLVRGPGGEARETKRERLADQLLTVTAPAVLTRADWARAVHRGPKDRTVGRALTELEERKLFAREQDGRWRRVAGGTPVGDATLPPPATQTELRLDTRPEESER